MKKTTRFLSLALAVVLAVSCLGSGALAAAKENVRQYEKYLVLGSSISRGYGLDGYYDNDASAKMLTGSYPCIVADACGVSAENRYIAAYGGMTASATLVILGEEEDFTDEYDINCFADKFKTDLIARYGTAEQCATLAKYGEPEQKVGFNKPINEIVKNSDLISLEYGIQDVFFRAVLLSGYYDLDTSDSDAMKQVISGIVSEAYKGYELFCKSLSRVIDHINGVNPNATITVLGIYNPVFNLRLEDEMFLPVGTAFSAITGLLNQKIKSIADCYENVHFVDISNVDTCATEDDTAILSEGFFAVDGGGPSTHPSPDSLRYIANQVLNALSKAEQRTATETDISVHMGKVRTVRSVTLDGKAVRDFTMNDSVLTVPCTTKNACLLTVVTLDENGTEGFYSYQLSYRDGYTAYRIFSTNSTAKKATTALKSVFSVISKLVSVVGFLFKK